MFNEKTQMWHWPFDCGNEVHSMNDEPYERRMETIRDFALIDYGRLESYEPVAFE